MCALVGPYMVGGKYVAIIIRGVGPAPVAAGVANVVDARAYFAADLQPNPQQALLEMNRLRSAVEEIRQKALALPANLAAAPRLYVQCYEGRSRSARCVGAFLMKVCNLSRVQANAALAAGYRNRVDGCLQNLNADAVDSWLMVYENSM